MEFNLDLLKMGYFILYRHEKGFVGNCIQDEQRRRGYNTENSRYTHVEVSGGEEHSVSINPPKAQLIDITKRHKGQHIRIVKYKGYDEDLTDRKRLKVAYFSACLCNKKYDWWGVLRFKLQWLTHLKKKFFCSEGAGWSLQKVFSDALDGSPPHEWMPADFTNPTWFIQTWEGNIV